MYKFIKPFGHHIYSDSIGGAWMDAVIATLEHGERALDEERPRLCLQNVRIRMESPKLPDQIIDKYGDKEKIDGIIYLTFKGNEMYDFDVVPSFSPGARSYYARLKEGRMDDYVVKRLGNIPESKKGVISFIHWDDYNAVLDTPYDDYLPCILTIQIRLIERGDEFEMTTNFNARSMDIYQKGNGNLIAIRMLAEKIQRELSKKLDKKVALGVIDGFITDIHVYGECVPEAKKVISKYKGEVSHGKSN